MYFHSEEWFTLHLGVDSFSSGSVKRDESSLLPPGVIELYLGLKGITHRNQLRRLSDKEVKRIAMKSTYQVKRVDWNQNGRLDFVMVAGIRDIAAHLKEPKWRKADTSSLMGEIGRLLSDIEGNYKRRISRTVTKIVNAGNTSECLTG